MTNEAYHQEALRIDKRVKQCSVATARWAEQHDWFVRTATTPEHKLAIVTEDECGVQHTFTDVNDLLAWAGY